LTPDEADDQRLILRMTPLQGFPSADVDPAPPLPPAACALCEPDRLLVLEGRSKGGFIDFIRDESGAIGWARMSRLHRRI
jgi:hypothetical protein